MHLITSPYDTIRLGQPLLQTAMLRTMWGHFTMQPDSELGSDTPLKSKSDGQSNVIGLYLGMLPYLDSLALATSAFHEIRCVRFGGSLE